MQAIKKPNGDCKNEEAWIEFQHADKEGFFFFQLAHIPLKTVSLALKPKQPIFKGKCALGL